LVDSPDLNDPQQNAGRARILHHYRSFILDHIPGDSRYRHARVEEDDLEKLFAGTGSSTLAQRSH